MSVAIQHITLKPSDMPLAVEFYAEVFQSKVIDHHYNYQSLQLKILGAYVIVTPSVNATSNSVIDVPSDRNSIQLIIHDKRFVIDPTFPRGSKVKLRDPFGISFILRDYEDVPMVEYHNPFNSLLPNPIASKFPTQIRPDELCTIKLTAMFVTRYGSAFRDALNKIAPTEFGFLNLNHVRGNLFYAFVDVYTSILKPSTKVDRSVDFIGTALEFFFQCLQLKKPGSETMKELCAFTSCVDYFAFMDVKGYSDVMPQPERLPVLRTPWSFPSRSTLSVPPQQLGVIKLTAMFVARHGRRIGCELMEKEDMQPLFSFLDPSDSGFPCYNKVVDDYSKVLNNYELVYTTETVVDRYFKCLEWYGEKGETMDLFSFVEGVDCFAQLEDEDFYHKMGNQLAHLYPFDQTSPSQVDKEGSSIIQVCVPTVYGRELIEITLDSFLWEEVASLKEKISKVLQMPSKELRLRGKAAATVLKDDKSLAENNVESGEILTVSWRFSRWGDY